MCGCCAVPHARSLLGKSVIFVESPFGIHFGISIDVLRTVGRPLHINLAVSLSPSQRTGTGVSSPSPSATVQQAALIAQEDYRVDAQKRVLVAQPFALLQPTAVPVASASAGARLSLVCSSLSACL